MRSARHLVRLVRPNARSFVARGELAEYSVVYNDRALNHMSGSFINVMQHLSTTMKQVYNGSSVAIVPGSGSYAMESAARQFATGKKVLIVRNGFFSYRWTQILDEGGITDDCVVLKAQRADDDPATPAMQPHPVDEVVNSILREKPAVVFAPHVETSAGMVLPDDYIKKVGAAAKEVGALFLLDCIASGATWVDMKALNVDILTTAPQKGWTGTPCAGIVVMNERARAAVDATRSTSFVLSLKTWLQVMEKYEEGGHMYHCTMPTDGLRQFSSVVRETQDFGWEEAKEAQQCLGNDMRTLFSSHGFKSIVHPDYAAASVLVCYGPPSLVGKFRSEGIQIAGGVPLMVDEPSPFETFRLGFFGLDKLADTRGYVQFLSEALERFK